MRMTSLFSIPTPMLIRWLRVLLPIHQILRSGQISEVWPILLRKSTINLFIPQFAQSNIHRHLETPSRTPYHLHTAPWKDCLCTGSDLRPLLQIQWPCQIYSHPSFTPYPHQQDPSWYQLRSAKENYTYHLHVPNPVLFHGCNSNLAPHSVPHPPIFRSSKLSKILPSA